MSWKENREKQKQFKELVYQVREKSSLRVDDLTEEEMESYFSDKGE